VKIKKGLKSLALASSLFLATNTMACAPIIKKFRIGNQDYKEVIEPEKKYAILMLGSYSKYSLFDEYLDKKAFEVYQDLKDLGFTDENIEFFANEDSEKLHNKRVDHVLTDDTFERSCEKLSKKITEDDMLFVIYIGHGNRKTVNGGMKKKKKYYLTDWYLDREKIEEELKDMDYAYSINVFDCCYSGGFAELLGKDNNVSISTSKKNEKSIIFQDFVLYMMDGLKGEEEADKNKDGKVSLDEAVDYAGKKDGLSKRESGIQSLFPEPQMYYEHVNPKEVFLD